MKTKTLLLLLSVAAFSSCSTAYKSGQTPDDVYYSPVRVVDEKQNNDRDDRDQVRYKPSDDYEITMSIRDRRWRDFRDDYDYSYSPYHYATCRTYNYGYYYNPYYYPWAIYTGKITYSAPVNTTPRMVNLNAYNGYNSKVAAGKTSGTISWSNPSTQYNNSNRSSSSRSEGRTRIVIFPRSNTSSSSSSNDTRTYTPSSNSSSGSSGSSSSGSSSSSSVSRPSRGG
jgi:uncharacterized membrane protein YgcG